MLRTPNSELRTPNSELRTLFPLLPNLRLVPHCGGAAIAYNGLAQKLLVFKQFVSLLAFVQPAQQGKGILVFGGFVHQGLPAAHGLAHAVKLTAAQAPFFKSTIWNLMRRSLNQRCAFWCQNFCWCQKSGCSCVFSPSVCLRDILAGCHNVIDPHALLTRINPMMHLSRSTPFTNR